MCVCVCVCVRVCVCVYVYAYVCVCCIVYLEKGWLGKAHVSSNLTIQYIIIADRSRI